MSFAKTTRSNRRINNSSLPRSGSETPSNNISFLNSPSASNNRSLSNNSQANTQNPNQGQSSNQGQAPRRIMTNNSFAPSGNKNNNFAFNPKGTGAKAGSGILGQVAQGKSLFEGASAGSAGLGAALNIALSAAQGNDGRELTADVLAAIGTAVASFFGGPLAGVGASLVAKPVAYDWSMLGESTESTRDSVGNILASTMSSGFSDIGRAFKINELGRLGKDVSNVLGKTGLFGTGNKESEMRSAVTKKFNKMIEESELEFDTFNGSGKFDSFYRDFEMIDDGKGGKTSKIEQQINALKEEIGEQDVEDVQKLGRAFAVVFGAGEAGAGDGQVGDSITMNVKGSREELKKFMAAAGVEDPSQLAGAFIQKFADGKLSVVETVEAMRALDRTYGTGFTGSEEVKRIASIVQAGGPDRYVDGSEFIIPDDNSAIERKDLLDKEGNPIDVANSQLIKNLEFIQKGEVPRNEDGTPMKEEEAKKMIEEAFKGNPDAQASFDAMMGSPSGVGGVGEPLEDDMDLSVGDIDPRTDKKIVGWTKSDPPRPIYEDPDNTKISEEEYKKIKKASKGMFKSKDTLTEDDIKNLGIDIEKFTEGMFSGVNDKTQYSKEEMRDILVRGLKDISGEASEITDDDIEKYSEIAEDAMKKALGGDFETIDGKQAKALAKMSLGSIAETLAATELGGTEGFSQEIMDQAKDIFNKGTGGLGGKDLVGAAGGSSSNMISRVPLSVEQSNLMDSFSRVTSGKSLTPSNPTDDIRYSMQIVREKALAEGRKPEEDAILKRATELLKQMTGESA